MRTTLAELIQVAIERRVAGLHTAMPGRITTFDFGSNLASVQPELKVKFVSEDVKRALPIIHHVPVHFPRTASAHLRLPVAVGDRGLLVFSERSLDAWIDGGEDTSDDIRKHDLSDAVFVPGLFPLSQPMEKAAGPKSAELKNKTAFVELRETGKIRIGNDQEELLKLLHDFMTAVEGLQSSGIDPQGGTVSSTVTTSLSGLKGRLGKLKV